MASRKKVMNNVVQIVQHIKDFNDLTKSAVKIESNKVVFSNRYKIQYIKITPQERTLLINYLQYEESISISRKLERHNSPISSKER